MPDLQAPPHNKMHTWIVVLLFWIIALLVFIVGYLVYGGKPAEQVALTPTELAAECTSNGFVDAATVPDDSGECPGPTEQAYTDPLFGLTYTYLRGWQIYTFNNDSFIGDSTMYIGNQPLSDCVACNGGIASSASIRVVKHKRPEGKDELDPYQTKLAELEAIDGITVTKSSELTGVIEWTDNNPCDGVGCTTGKNAIWYFGKNATLYTGTLLRATDDDLAAWELFTTTVE